MAYSKKCTFPGAPPLASDQFQLKVIDSKRLALAERLAVKNGVLVLDERSTPGDLEIDRIAVQFRFQLRTEESTGPADNGLLTRSTDHQAAPAVSLANACPSHLGILYSPGNVGKSHEYEQGGERGRYISPRSWKGCSCHS